MFEKKNSDIWWENEYVLYTIFNINLYVIKFNTFNFKLFVPKIIMFQQTNYTTYSIWSPLHPQTPFFPKEHRLNIENLFFIWPKSDHHLPINFRFSDKQNYVSTKTPKSPSLPSSHMWSEYNHMFGWFKHSKWGPIS